jgi:hypothetical protein
MRFIGGQEPEGYGQVQEYFEGLNALWTTPKLIEAFREMRLHVEG